MNDQNEMGLPCILICPMCGQISIHDRRGVLVFPVDFVTNKECSGCGEDVPLLFFGMNAGSWSLRESNVPVFVT
jgi:hypothetical protein